MQTQGRISDGETLSAEERKHSKRNKDEAFKAPFHTPTDNFLLLLLGFVSFKIYGVLD